MREPRSRTRSPYAPPKAAPAARGGASRFRRILWWGLLLAPCLGILLTISVTGALYEIGYPVTDGLRDTLIETSGSFVSALVQAALLFPSAWLLERVVHRLGPDSEHSRLLALPITVVWVYALGATELLEQFDYVPHEHPVAWTVRLASGLTLVAFIPLLLVWAAVAFRQRRR